MRPAREQVHYASVGTRDLLSEHICHRSLRRRVTGVTPAELDRFAMRGVPVRIGPRLLSLDQRPGVEQASLGHQSLERRQPVFVILLIWAFGWNWVDPIASVVIGVLVIYSSWSLVRQSVTVLMEGAPGHLSVDDIHAALLELPGVSNVHDLHVWTITSGFVALSAHVTCPELDNQHNVLRAAQNLLSQRFGIQHTTIQIDRDPSCEATAHPDVESSSRHGLGTVDDRIARADRSRPAGDDR